ncbi:MAG: OmpA family protein [Bacteroidetes bacterium]|nr:OmpA family protein [Bacteroidota bacterium]
MKKLIFVYSLILAFGFIQTSQAQFFEKLKKKTEEKVKKEGEKRVEEKVNKGVEKAYDEAEKQLTGSSDKKKEDSTKSKDSQKNLQTIKETENNPQVVINSKYDFIPGEKVIFFDDFTSENIGDFPIQWNTTGSGEVVTTNLFPGRWFHITNGRGVTTLDAPVTLPENYTIEFDVVPQKDPKNNGGTTYNFYLISTIKPKDLIYGLARPGGTGIKFEFGYNNYYSAYYSDGTPDQRGSVGENRLLADKKYRISIWVQKQRIRLYKDQEKLFDLPRVVPKTVKYNMVRFDGGIPMIGNFRVATGLPDMRSKLLTEGKLISYGIYFDVNKDVVKPESYPSIKEIAAILNDNPNVNIKIVGHTDSDGDNNSNLDLSKRRAASVKNALVKDFNVDASRIEFDGKGESEPVSPNDSITNKALNRRVEFIKL